MVIKVYNLYGEGGVLTSIEPSIYVPRVKQAMAHGYFYSFILKQSIYV